MVHLIFVCKYRKKLLINLGLQIKEIFYNIAKEKGFQIVEMEIDNKYLLIGYGE